MDNEEVVVTPGEELQEADSGEALLGAEAETTEESPPTSTGTYVFPTLDYQKDWTVREETNEKYIATYSNDEEEVRGKMQLLFNDIKDKWNGDLREGIEGYLNSFEGLRPRGAYKPEAQYQFRDVVSFEHKNYIAVYLENRQPVYFDGVEPGTNEQYWQEFLDCTPDVKSVSMLPGEVTSKNDGGSTTLSVQSNTGTRDKSFVVSMEGTGYLPLIEATAQRFTGAGGSNKLNDVLSLIPNVEFGTYSGKGNKTPKTSITFRAKPILAIIFGPSYMTVLTSGSPTYWYWYRSGNGNYYTYIRPGLTWSSDGKTVTVDTYMGIIDESGENNYQYIAFCSDAFPGVKV